MIGPRETADEVTDASRMSALQRRRRDRTLVTRRQLRAQQLGQGKGHDARGLGEVVERQALVGAMRVGLLDGARSRAVEDDRHARRRVVPRIGVERHALGRRRVRP